MNMMIKLFACFLIILSAIFCSKDKETSNSNQLVPQNNPSKTQLLCKQWRLYKIKSPGSDVNDGWKPSIIIFDNDTQNIYIYSFNIDKKYVKYNKEIKKTNYKSDTIVIYREEGDWKFNLDSTQIEISRTILNGKDVSPYSTKYFLNRILNDTLVISYNLRSGTIFWTYIPCDKNKLR